LLTKIHPATYLMVAAALAGLGSRGGVARWAARIATESPGVMVFAAAVVLLFLHVVAVQHLPISAIVDTMALPILVFALLATADPASKPPIALLLHLFIAVNAVIGLVEYGSGWRLVPLYDIDGKPLYDWRSTALLGSPLNDAFVTGCWMVVLAVGARDLSAAWRAAGMVLAAAALVAFGGRVAMVFAFLAIAAIGVLGTSRLLAGRRFDLTAAAVAIAATTLLAAIAIVLLDAGAADRLIDRFSNDSGSAATRVAMFGIFTDLDWPQFLLAPPPEAIGQAQRQYGIPIGIESTEVAFVAFYGLIPAVLLLGALGAFLFELVRATSWTSLWPVGFFIVVMSASTGLSSKSTNLAIFTAMVLTMLPIAGSSAAVGRRP
jgi:hypothetical protein